MSWFTLNRLIIFFLLLLIEVTAYEPLPKNYQVTFGSEEAPLNITQYFSLSCPHCIALFRKDFKEIKKHYIDTGKISYTFHPVPLDLGTMELLICLEELDNTQKQLLLGVLLEEIELENPDLTTIMLKQAMELFKRPLPNLDNENFIKNSTAFAVATQFIIQEDKPTTIPSIQVGDNRVERAPDFEFLSLFLSMIYKSESHYEK